jgi:hypothetical protein
MIKRYYDVKYLVENLEKLKGYLNNLEVRLSQHEPDSGVDDIYRAECIFVINLLSSLSLIFPVFRTFKETEEATNKLHGALNDLIERGSKTDSIKFTDLVERLKAYNLKYFSKYDLQSFGISVEENDKINYYKFKS